MEKKIAVAKRRVFLDFFFLSERTIIMNNFEILELELDSLGKKILHCCAEKKKKPNPRSLPSASQLTLQKREKIIPY